MLDRPDKTDLLSAVAEFLDADVRPAVADRRVSFRLRIASHLLRSVAGQLGAEDAADRAELTSLAALLGAGGGPTPDPAALARALAQLRGEMVHRIRDPATGDDEIARLTGHVQETLRRDLAVAAPRFDTSPEIENP